MSISILILGESGSGKSMSLQYLDPSETFLLSVIDKPLPFSNEYKKIKGDMGNMFICKDAYKIVKTIKYISSQRPEIKTLIIDDFQYVMSLEFFDRALEKGYEKFSELGKKVVDMLESTRNCRSDLNIYFLAHSQINEEGKHVLKTIGKMLDEKFTPEGLFTFVIHSLYIDDKYKFLTNRDKTHSAKTPFGMFEDKYIDNDINFVNQKIKSFSKADEDISQ